MGFLLVSERVFVYNWDMFGSLTAADDELVDIDTSLLCDSETRERLIEARREIDRLESYTARLLVSADGRGVPQVEGASSTPVWVQFQTGQRLRDARVSLATGKACDTLPVVAKAWAQGEISANAAATISQGRRPGHEDVYATMEERLVAYAAVRDYAPLDAMIRRYQTRCDELDDKDPTERNGLFISPVGNRWALKGDHDQLGGATIRKAVEVATDKPVEGDTRSAARRRADAMERICRSFLDWEDLPTEDGEPPHVAITVPLESLLTGDLETTGDLALAASQVSQLLGASKIQLIILGTDGRPLEVGAAIYRPSRKLRRAVLHRDRGRCDIQAAIEPTAKCTT